jgi:ankyrin repeat protein
VSLSTFRLQASPLSFSSPSASRINDRGQSPLAGAVFKNEDAVIQALLGGGADPYCGNPTAYDTAKLFGKLGKWGDAFENAKGSLRRKAS